MSEENPLNEKRKRVTFTLNPDLIARLREISAETMIPQARLVERALEKVIEEYETEEK